ncbi:MAG: hypothetical protein J6A01_09995 [Proteobacteria bacterium]|nr:hypothetical protein [Pseudomonadota bacterium]
MCDRGGGVGKRVSAHQKCIYAAILGAVLFAAGCSDDSNGDKKGCGENEIESNGVCVCDTATNYYGTPGSCILCEGEHKIVKDNNCVCDDNGFEDDGNGGCKAKTSSLSCGDHEKESEGACVCDNDAKYYGSAGSCALCEGEHKTVKDNSCVCEDNFEDDGNGGCKEKDAVECGENEKAGDDGCVCDNDANYYGEAGSCALCEGENKVVKENACVCDDGYEDDGNGGCKEAASECGENEKAGDDGCVCDGDKGYYGEAGSCTLCEGENKVVKENACVCDDGYADDGDGGCKAACGENEIEKYGVCACNDEANYYGEAGSCQLCSGDHKVITGNDCVCDDGYEDDGKGACQLKCAEHEKVSKDACVCDDAAKYYGESGSCQLCDGTGQIIKDNSCICDASKHLVAGSAGTHAISCVCDAASKYYGTAGSCQLCTGDHKIIINNSCVCNSSEGYEDDGKGGCKKIAECVSGATRCGTGSNANSLQTCNSDGQYGTFVDCKSENKHKICGPDPLSGGKDNCVCEETNMWTHNDAGECVCNTANHWFKTTDGECECNFNEGYQSDGKGGCACTHPRFYLNGGVCTKCKYTLTESECINKVGDIISFGKYPQATSTSEPIKWRVIDINTSTKSVLLLSEYVIDGQKYYNVTDHSKAQSKWIPSDLKQWLENDFKNKAFSSLEKVRIDQAKHDSTGNSQVDPNPPHNYKNNEGANFDNITLLAFKEVLNYLPTDADRKTTATKYALDQLGSSSYKCWGTRSPIANDSLHYFACIDKSGTYETSSGTLTSEQANYKVAIRPAIWVKYSE